MRIFKSNPFYGGGVHVCVCVRVYKHTYILGEYNFFFFKGRTFFFLMSVSFNHAKIKWRQDTSV